MVSFPPVGRCIGAAAFCAIAGVSFHQNRKRGARLTELSREIPYWIEPNGRGWSKSGKSLQGVLQKYIAKDHPTFQAVERGAEENWHGAYLVGKEGVNALLPRTRAEIIAGLEGRHWPVVPWVAGGFAILFSYAVGVGTLSAAWAVGALYNRPDFATPARVAEQLDRGSTFEEPEVAPLIEARERYLFGRRRIREIAREVAGSLKELKPLLEPLKSRDEDSLHDLRSLRKEIGHLVIGLRRGDIRMKKRTLLSIARRKEGLKRLGGLAGATELPTNGARWEELKPKLREVERISTTPPNYEVLIAEAKASLLLRSCRAERDLESLYAVGAAFFLSAISFWVRARGML